MAHGRAEELTGRRRYREDELTFGRGSAMVLQVEVSCFNNVYEGKPGRWVCEWRDATPADIAEGELV
jgi:hypothetical protein